jgi:signal transduction histidine kinase
VDIVELGPAHPPTALVTSEQMASEINRAGRIALYGLYFDTNRIEIKSESKRIDLHVNVAPELGDVTLDQQKFKQVLYNLLSNAIKFTEDGGKVELFAEPNAPHRFKLVFKDTGIGIKAEDVGRLFKEFEQLDSSASRHHEGTGLGLALTRRIVEWWDVPSLVPLHHPDR